MMSDEELRAQAAPLRAVKVRGRTLITRADQCAWLDSLPAMRGRNAA